MDKPNRIVPPGARRCRQVTLLALIAFATASFAASASASAGLPDTPAGKLGGELIRHVNTDTPEQIRQWAAAVLSPAMDQTDQADFVSSLVSAARDSGGMDLADVRSNPHQPGLLQLAVKTHRTGQWALFVVAAHSISMLPFPTRMNRVAVVTGIYTTSKVSRFRSCRMPSTIARQISVE